MTSFRLVFSSFRQPIPASEKCIGRHLSSGRHNVSAYDFTDTAMMSQRTEMTQSRVSSHVNRISATNTNEAAKVISPLPLAAATEATQLQLRKLEGRQQTQKSLLGNLANP